MRYVGEAVAAVALAIHLSSAGARPRVAAGSAPLAGTASTWAAFGRGKLMSDRMTVFDRVQKK